MKAEIWKEENTIPSGQSSFIHLPSNFFLNVWFGGQRFLRNEDITASVNSYFEEKDLSTTLMVKVDEDIAGRIMLI